jgi:AraC-like DNA-binding protein
MPACVTETLFHARQPAPPLDLFVESVWLCKNDPRPRALERILPSGGAQLIVNLTEDETRAYSDSRCGLVCRRSPGSILTGVTTRFQVIDTDEQAYVAGVAFRPGGTVPFVAGSAYELRDTEVPLEALWGPARTRRLREQLLTTVHPDSALDILERALLESWRDRSTHPLVAFALADLHLRPSVARIGQIANAVGLSRKRFSERFKTEVGVTPKRYCRLLRFQRALAKAHGGGSVDWKDLALACGYFDQAHLIHEFREFSGLTPTAYSVGRTLFQNHVTFLQSVDGEFRGESTHG